MIADEPIEVRSVDADEQMREVDERAEQLARDERNRNTWQLEDLPIRQERAPDPTRAMKGLVDRLRARPKRSSASAMLDLVCHEAAIAEEVARPVKGFTEQTTGYHFGADPARIVKTLRALADDIEGQGTTATEMTFTSKIKADEFLHHTLSIDFVTRTDEDRR
jgi:hypothetical protein